VPFVIEVDALAKTCSFVTNHRASPPSRKVLLKLSLFVEVHPTTLAFFSLAARQPPTSFGKVHLRQTTGSGGGLIQERQNLEGHPSTHNSFYLHR